MPSGGVVNDNKERSPTWLQDGIVGRPYEVDAVMPQRKEYSIYRLQFSARLNILDCYWLTSYHP